MSRRHLDSGSNRARQSPLAATTLPLLLILAVAAFLRFYYLDASSLWSDEGNTWALIQRSFAEISRDAAADIHPPGYYWLLKLWSQGFGFSAAAIRSLSALLGVLVVLQVYFIGRTLARSRALSPAGALLAALIVTFNPFQIFYSQEARMYMLLTLEAALLGWATIRLLRRQVRPEETIGTWPQLLFVLAGVAGLWTHYSFPIILLAADLALLWTFLVQGADKPIQRRLFLRIVLLNLLVAVAFLPWLQTALTGTLNWPSGGSSVPPTDALILSLQSLLFGPMPTLPAPLWPWLTVFVLGVGLGSVVLLRRPAGRFLILWALMPIALLFTFGLFSDAFLKILLIASPAWSLLLAAAVANSRLPQLSQRAGQIGLILLLLSAAYATLPAYYTDPHVRDNYAGISRYLAAVAHAEEDLLILNAPGQQEVWRYYDPGISLLALPQERPAKVEPTISTLAAAIADRKRVHAIYWATDESDPDGIVEGWLERNSFKGAESWQGDIRFVTYHLAEELRCRQLEPDVTFSQEIAPAEICGISPGMSVAAGDVLLVGMHWRALTSITEDYAVSVQVQDEQSNVVAQHDGVPGGGSAPTASWTAGELIADNHGIHIPVGTPPGRYRIAVALYDPASGHRLTTTDGDMMLLGEVTIGIGDQTLPIDLLPAEHIVDQQLGPIRLAAYSLHRQGFAHAPQTAIAPEDNVEFVFYWQAPDPLPSEWPKALQYVLTLGNSAQTVPLAGNNYPTALWSAGEVVRGTLVVSYDGVSNHPTLRIGDKTIGLAKLPLR